MGVIMKTIGILGAMDVEIVYIREIMNIEEIVQYAGFNFYVGKYKNLKLIVVESGIGKVNAACSSQILITKFNVTHVINFGIAGSLRNNVRICDIVIGHEVLYHDVSDAQMNSLFPQGQYFYADDFLEKAAIEAFSEIELKECNYHLGTIATGEDFISNENMKRSIAVRSSGCCVDMESAAIAHVCHLNEIPFISIRCVSNDLYENTTEYNTELDQICAFSAARFTIRMLNILVKY